MEWIKISDRLPEFSGYYIVCYTESQKHVAPAYFSDIDKNFSHIRTGNDFLTVYFWMPLPEPPKTY